MIQIIIYFIGMLITCLIGLSIIYFYPKDVKHAMDISDNVEFDVFIGLGILLWPILLSFFIFIYIRKLIDYVLNYALNKGLHK